MLTNDLFYTANIKMPNVRYVEQNKEKQVSRDVIHASTLSIGCFSNRTGTSVGDGKVRGKD